MKRKNKPWLLQAGHSQVTVKMYSKVLCRGWVRVCFLLPWGEMCQRIDFGAHVQEEGREENGASWKLNLLEECRAGKGSGKMVR